MLSRSWATSLAWVSSSTNCAWNKPFKKNDLKVSKVLGTPFICNLRFLAFSCTSQGPNEEEKKKEGIYSTVSDVPLSPAQFPFRLFGCKLSLIPCLRLHKYDSSNTSKTQTCFPVGIPFSCRKRPGQDASLVGLSHVGGTGA